MPFTTSVSTPATVAPGTPPVRPIAAEPAPRRCPLCDRDNLAEPIVRYSQAPWRLKACPACSLVYLENPPGYDALADEFAWEKTSRAETQHRRKGRRLRYLLISDPLKKLKGLLRGRGLRPKERRWIERHIPRGRLLDVGCGEGRTLMALPAGMVPYGVEISPVLARLCDGICRAAGGFTVCDNAIDGALQFQADFFDGVMMRAFLEHETQPRRLLEAAHRVTRPGGRIIIKVPNYGCLNRRIAGARWCGFRFPDHVNYFSPRTLSRLLDETGFRIVRSRLIDHPPLSDNMWIVAQKPGPSSSTGPTAP